MLTSQPMLDSFTLAIAATVAALGFCLSMHMLRYLIPQEQSLRYWSMSSLLTVLGLLLQSQRNAWPDELTWLIANTLVMTAGVLLAGLSHVGRTPSANLDSAGGGNLERSGQPGCSHRMAVRPPPYCSLVNGDGLLSSWRRLGVLVSERPPPEKNSQAHQWSDVAGQPDVRSAPECA